MNPFWAVRRMTHKQLVREVALAEPGKVRPRFNCQMEGQAVSCVTVGIVKSQSVNTTRICEVPFLTNSLEVEEGEELILEVREKTVDKPAGKRTWKQAFQDEEKTKKNIEKSRIYSECWLSRGND